MDKMKKTIRPAARLLKTIGQDLIKDVYAAIVELVKNSYDADSADALIKLRYDEKNSRLITSVIDHGDGMSFDIVVNKWLVPATDDKLIRKRSERGRILQGRKGIGRFAAAVLGERILLETTAEGITTSLVLDMEELDKVEFLDQLELYIETEITNKANGTIIEIEKDNISIEDVGNVWNSQQIRKLFVELRSLTAPEEVYNIASQQGFDIYHDDFKIKLKFEDFPVESYSNREIDVKPFPVLELYDYKITGRVNTSGRAIFYFENKNIQNFPVETIDINIPISTDNGYQVPGDVFIDLRVYDRDSESITNIINRGLKDPETGEFLGKLEARKVLDEYYGVGIYREQFRIRPYGEQGFDWLDLDKSRVQNPSFKIGHNQIIGFLYIRPEEISGLKEKSARDGLVENSHYYGLKAIVSQAIKELEVRRYNYRKAALRGGRNRTLDDDIDSLFNFDETKNKIAKRLDELEISKKDKESFVTAIGDVLDNEKKKKSAYAKKIRETIAVYQGQATLGRITHVLLHEGRKNVKYISETAPRINKWVQQCLENPDSSLEEKIRERAQKVVSHAKGLSFLFKKIEPLARTRRSPDKAINLKNELESVFAIFSTDIESNNILVSLSIDKDLTLMANQVDLITIFSNLIENSVFWLASEKENISKTIKIVAEVRGDDLFLEYQDSGPGFQGVNLEQMFDPGYSTKLEGTGLGLALAGIEAIHSDEGAMFELVFKGKK